MVLFSAVSNWIKPLWVVGVGMVAALAVMLLLLYVLGLSSAEGAGDRPDDGQGAMHQPLFYLILLIGVVLLIFLPALQHVRRRREDGQVGRADADQDSGGDPGGLDGQRIDRRRDRRAYQC